MECIKGFKDSLNEEAIKRKKIKEILIRNFELYGFEPIETPIIETEDFVKSENPEDEAVSDIFRLCDKGKRNLALRYEFTFQLKRIAKNKKRPYKIYQIGPVFRDEPVYQNRLRQITQADIDVVGSNGIYEAEILQIAKKVLDELGINSEIFINSRKLLNEILTEQKIKKENFKEVIKQIDKLDKLNEKEVLINLKKFNAEKILEIFKKPEKYFEKYESYKEIKELKENCKKRGVKVNFLPSLARGLGYYNSSVFEIKSKKIKETICGGGSYLIDSIQSCGISFGIERLSFLSNIEIENKRVLLINLITEKKAIDLSEKLRKKGVNVSSWFDKGVSKALEYADSYKIPYVIFLGEEEMKNNKIKLKNMKSGKEKLLTEKEVVDLLVCNKNLSKF